MAPYQPKPFIVAIEDDEPSGRPYVVAIEDDPDAPTLLDAPAPQDPLPLAASHSRPGFLSKLAPSHEDTTIGGEFGGRGASGAWEPEATWGETLTAMPRSLGDMVQRLGGAALQQLGEAPLSTQVPGTVATGEELAGVETRTPEEVAAAGSYGANLYREAEEAIQGKKPKGMSFGQELLYDTSMAFAQMVPTLAVGAATRSPAAALVPMAAQVRAETYAAKRKAGRTPDEAAFDADIAMAIEAGTEYLPLSWAFKRGTPFVMRLLETTLGEGVQEGASGLLQSLYDKATTNPEITFGDALKQAGYEGLVGVALGGLLGGAGAGVESLASRRSREPGVEAPPPPVPQLAPPVAEEPPVPFVDPKLAAAQEGFGAEEPPQDDEQMTALLADLLGPKLAAESLRTRARVGYQDSRAKLDRDTKARRARLLERAKTRAAEEYGADPNVTEMLEDFTPEELRAYLARPPRVRPVEPPPVSGEPAPQEEALAPTEPSRPGEAVRAPGEVAREGEGVRGADVAAVVPAAQVDAPAAAEWTETRYNDRIARLEAGGVDTTAARDLASRRWADLPTEAQERFAEPARKVEPEQIYRGETTPAPAPAQPAGAAPATSEQPPNPIQETTDAEREDVPAVREADVEVQGARREEGEVGTPEAGAQGGAPARPGKPRLAENVDDLYRAVIEKSKTGVVSDLGRILYPAVRIFGEGDFVYQNEKWWRREDGGRTLQPATTAQVDAIHEAMETDTAQIFLPSQWGGSGTEKSTRSRPVQDLHSPSGMSWKTRDEFLAGRPSAIESTPDTSADAGPAPARAAPGETEDVLRVVRENNTYKAYVGDVFLWKHPDKDVLQSRLQTEWGRDWDGVVEAEQAPVPSQPAAVKESLTAGEAPAEPLTLAAWPALRKRILSMDLTAEELKAEYQRFKDSEPGLRAELEAKTLKDLAPNGTRGEKKAEVVWSILSNMRQRFIVSDGGFQWQPFSETMEQAVQRYVDATTDETIAEVKGKQAARRQETEKALTNPETLAEYHRFVSYRGEAALTPEQRARFDELRAEATKMQRQAETERKATVRQVDTGDTGMKLVETVHTRDKYPLWVVQLEARVERETYDRLNDAAKTLGGWYSAFTRNGAVPGFQFKDKESAEKFMAVREGDVSAADRVEARAETKQKNAVVRLRALSDGLEGKADEVLSADRKTNTARRVREAGRVEGRAYADQALARTMRNLADAIESGEATHLDGLSQRVQVEMLDTYLRRGMIARERADDISYAKAQGRSPETRDVEFVKYPRTEIYAHIASDIARELESKPGGGSLARQLRARIPGGDPDAQVLVAHDLAERIVKKLGERGAGWQLREVLADETRLRRMGIENEPMLRAALREYLQFREGKQAEDPIKAAERALVGQKVGVDFFPSPPAVVREVMDRAGIEPGMRVLEPSAGKGSLADAAKSAGAAVDVVELSSTLRDLLTAKGHRIVGQDFTDYEAEPYDRVVMNPPFSNRQDVEHVRKAYDLLKPGGKLVAIMSEGPFFGTDKKASEFRDWLASVGGTSEPLPEGSFKDSGTGVATRIVEVEKKEEAASRPLDDAKRDYVEASLRFLDAPNPEDSDIINRARSEVFQLGGLTEADLQVLVSSAQADRIGLPGLKKELAKLEAQQSGLYRKAAGEVPGRVAVGRKAHRSNRMDWNANRMGWLREQIARLEAPAPLVAQEPGPGETQPAERGMGEGQETQASPEELEAARQQYREAAEALYREQREIEEEKGAIDRTKSEEAGRLWNELVEKRRKAGKATPRKGSNEYKHLAEVTREQAADYVRDRVRAVSARGIENVPPLEQAKRAAERNLNRVQLKGSGIKVGDIFVDAERGNSEMRVTEIDPDGTVTIESGHRYGADEKWNATDRPRPISVGAILENYVRPEEWAGLAAEREEIKVLPGLDSRQVDQFLYRHRALGGGALKRAAVMEEARAASVEGEKKEAARKAEIDEQNRKAARDLLDTVRPLSALRVNPSRGWQGNRLVEGDFASDGHAAVRLDAVPVGRRKPLLKAPSVGTGSGFAEEMFRSKLWDPAVKAATETVEALGTVDGGSAKSPMPVTALVDGDTFVAALDSDILRYVQSLTGSDEIRVRKKDPDEGPAVLYKKGDPVAIVMPMRIEESRIPPIPEIRAALVGGAAEAVSLEATPADRASTAAPPEPLPPLTAERVRQAFPGARVRETPTGYRVSFGAGRPEIRVLQVADIPITEKAAAGYGMSVTQMRRAVDSGGYVIAGSFGMVDGQGVLALSKHRSDTTIDHEAFHAAIAMALTPDEIAAVISRHGSEEKAARAYQNWAPGGEERSTLFAKIARFFRRLAEALGIIGPDGEVVFGRIRSGEVWQRDGAWGRMSEAPDEERASMEERPDIRAAAEADAAAPADPHLSTASEATDPASEFEATLRAEAGMGDPAPVVAAAARAGVIRRPHRLLRWLSEAQRLRIASTLPWMRPLVGDSAVEIQMDEGPEEVGLPSGYRWKDLREILSQTKLGALVYESARKFKTETVRRSSAWKHTYDEAVKGLTAEQKGRVRDLLDTEESPTEEGPVGDAARKLRTLTTEIGEALMDRGYLSALRQAYLPHLFQGSYWVRSDGAPAKKLKTEWEALLEGLERKRAGHENVSVWQDTFIAPDDGMLLSSKAYRRLVKMVSQTVGEQVELANGATLDEVQALLDDELLEGADPAAISRALRKGKVARPKPRLRFYGNLQQRVADNPNFEKDLDTIFAAYTYGAARKITQDEFLKTANAAMEAMPPEHRGLRRFIEDTYLPTVLAHPNEYEKAVARFWRSNRFFRRPGVTGQDVRNFYHNLNLVQYAFDMGFSFTSAAANATQALTNVTPIVGEASLAKGYADLAASYHNPARRKELEDAGVLAGISAVSGEVLQHGARQFGRQLAFQEGLKGFGEATLMPFGWVEATNRIASYWAGKHYATKELARGAAPLALAKKVTDENAGLRDLAAQLAAGQTTPEAFARAFAVELVDKTQFRHGRENLPLLLQGEVPIPFLGWLSARLVSPYKSFLLSQLRYAADTYRLGSKESGRGLLGDPKKALRFSFYTFALGGAAGNPLLWGIALALNKLSRELFDEDWTDELDKIKKGVTGALGFDISGSLAVHLPTTFEDFLGRYGRLFLHTGQLLVHKATGTDTVFEGRRIRREAQPALFQRGRDAARILDTGTYVSPIKGTPVAIGGSPTAAAAKRLLGVMPRGVSDAFDESAELRDREAAWRTRSSDLSERWATARAEGRYDDARAVIEEVRQKLRDAQAKLRRTEDRRRQADIREEIGFYRSWLDSPRGRKQAYERHTRPLQDRMIEDLPTYMRGPARMREEEDEE